MRTLLIVMITALLAGCSSTTCPTHKDEASCTADKACHWNANESACKA